MLIVAVDVILFGEGELSVNVVEPLLPSKWQSKETLDISASPATAFHSSTIFMSQLLFVKSNPVIVDSLLVVILVKIVWEIAGVIPLVPEVPLEPLTPEVPEDPFTPEVPEEPDDPDDPILPETPDEPDVPLVPDVPDDPVAPETPLEPEVPLVPELPLEPAAPEPPEVPPDPL